MRRPTLRRTGISRVIAGAVVVLVAVAGVDALRSSGNGATAPATPSTTGGDVTGSGPPPRCTPEQTDVTFDFAVASRPTSCDTSAAVSVFCRTCSSA
jgi:hypothetical protein